MKILIDIGHPAHVHLFRYFAEVMTNKGHEILFTCRDKEFEIYLLKRFNFNYKSFGKKYLTSRGKLIGLIEFDLKAYITGLRFKPDLFLSHGSIYAAHASFLLRKPHITLEDTFNLEQLRLYRPFTETILTGNYYHPLKSNKVIQYAGYHELAYLHPNYFKPDSSVLDDIGVKIKEKYSILRFVAWNASHDIGHQGISIENKIKAVAEFSKYSKVFISSESKLPYELEKYKIKISPEKMHDALAFASLHWAESFTMPAECAVLGTPSIIMNNSISYYLKEMEEKYGLCYSFSESSNDQERAINKGIEILKDENISLIWKQKQERMLKEKIDVTGFLVWFVENFPESKKIMKQKPDFQYNFK